MNDRTKTKPFCSWVRIGLRRAINTNGPNNSSTNVAYCKFVASLSRSAKIINSFSSFCRTVEGLSQSSNVHIADRNSNRVGKYDSRRTINVRRLTLTMIQIEWFMGFSWPTFRAIENRFWTDIQTKLIHVFMPLQQRQHIHHLQEVWI